MTAWSPPTSQPGCRVSEASSESPTSQALYELELRISSGLRAGQLLRVPGEKFAIGSGSGCSLELRSPQVAPIHLLGVHGPEGTLVRAMAQDTRLNGRPFDYAWVHKGDCLSVGPIDLEILDDPNAPPNQRETPVTSSTLVETQAAEFPTAPIGSTCSFEADSTLTKETPSDSSAESRRAVRRAEHARIRRLLQIVRDQQVAIEAERSTRFLGAESSPMLEATSVEPILQAEPEASTEPASPIHAPLAYNLPTSLDDRSLVESVVEEALFEEPVADQQPLTDSSLSDPNHSASAHEQTAQEETTRGLSESQPETACESSLSELDSAVNFEVTETVELLVESQPPCPSVHEISIESQSEEPEGSPSLSAMLETETAIETETTPDLSSFAPTPIAQEPHEPPTASCSEPLATLSELSDASPESESMESLQAATEILETSVQEAANEDPLTRIRMSIASLLQTSNVNSVYESSNADSLTSSTDDSSTPTSTNALLAKFEMAQEADLPSGDEGQLLENESETVSQEAQGWSEQHSLGNEFVCQVDSVYEQIAYDSEPIESSFPVHNASEFETPVESTQELVGDDSTSEVEAQAETPTVSPEPAFTSIEDPLERLKYLQALVASKDEAVGQSPTSPQESSQLEPEFAGESQELLARETSRSTTARASHSTTRGSNALRSQESPNGDEDESIDAYMAKLLARVGGSSIEPSVTHEAGPVKKDAEPLLKQTFQKELDQRAEEFKAGNYVPRSAPERMADLKALRDVANATARAAIDTSQRKKNGTAALGWVIGSGVSLVIAVMLLKLSTSPLSVNFMGSVLCMFGCGYCIRKAMNLRAPSSQKPKSQEYLEREAEVLLSESKEVNS